MTSIFDQDLHRNEANFAPITPLSFIERAAEVYPQRAAIVHGTLRRTWVETYGRCRRLASSLQRAGIRKGDTVAVMLPNAYSGPKAPAIPIESRHHFRLEPTADSGRCPPQRWAAGRQAQTSAAEEPQDASS